MEPKLLERKRFETNEFHSFIAEFYCGENIAPIDACARALYNFFNKSCTMLKLEKILRATCVQNENEPFIRKDFWVEVLSLRFSTNLAHMVPRMACLCNPAGDPLPWFRPFDDRKQSEVSLRTLFLPWVVRFTSEDRGIFVFVYPNKNAFLHIRIFLGEYGYWINARPNKFFPNILELIMFEHGEHFKKIDFFEAKIYPMSEESKTLNKELEAAYITHRAAGNALLRSRTTEHQVAFDQINAELMSLIRKQRDLFIKERCGPK